MKNSLPIEKILWMDPAKGVAASGCIPCDAEFFQDHFPDFPILPGVLVLEILKRTAECYFQAPEASRPPRFSLKQIRGVRFPRYLKPGDEWESRLEILAHDGRQSRWSGRLFHAGRMAASAELVLDEFPAAHEQAAA